MFDLTGKKALVTGATGGIGEAIAAALKAAGADVLASGTNPDKLAKLSNDYKTIACDLSDAESVQNLPKAAEEQLGGLDILINNAGITRDNLFMRMKDEDWQQVLDINLTANFQLMRASIRGMMKQRFGRIINITSIVGVMGNAGQANYAASKAGLIGMTKSVAAEVANRGITANCIAPGFITTPMTEKLTDTQKNAMLGNIPAGAFGTPKDIASACLYLSAEESAYVTGQTLHINGGMLMI